jgi:hypothetical protein
MKRFIFFLIILLLPVYSWAAYKIYLYNGAEISGVKSYDEVGDEVNLYLDTGSITVPKKDIVKIEGKESPASDSGPKEEQETRPKQRQETPQEIATPSGSPGLADDKNPRISELRAELDSITTEIKAAEEQESKLVAAINEKTGARFKYNLIQLRQLEKELEPLKQELGTVQQKKEELKKTRSDIEAQLKTLE